ncbi:MAG: flagellar assembly protein FliW [Proteobacteria bacterium]|nr:flagellar assembly protein FliW [Pseudomonadota bacterium]
MEITTARFGVQAADPEKTIYFPAGIVGFERCKKFQLFHETEKKHSIYYLQSHDQAELMIHTVEPEVLGIKYDFTLSEDYLSLLDADCADSLIALCLISKDRENNAITPHPDCPIIVNTVNKRAIQIKAGEVRLDEKIVSKAA